MTAEIINLRRARKRKVREADERKAQQNRALFGRSKAETRVMQAEKDAANRTLDGARREDDGGTY